MKTFQWTTFVLNGIEGKSDNTFLMWYYTHLKTHRQKTFECKLCSHISKLSGPSWSWSFGIWIYNYPCNQCLSPLMLWVWVPLMMRCTTLCDKVCQWLAAGWWFSLGTLVSSTNKADLHDITEILLKVALNTIRTKTNQKLSSQNAVFNVNYVRLDVFPFLVQNL
jgi:hypothetical protein